MGIHLCCKTIGHEDHPGWDWIRHAGDRDFVNFMNGLPTDRTGPDGEYSRPTAFVVWRVAIADVIWPNPGRYEKLMDLLEADPKYWIYVSF